MKEENTTEVSYLLNLNEDVIDNDAFTPHHASFFHYTVLNSAKRILTNSAHNYFYASNVNQMNDVDEATRYRNIKKQIYSVCFCNNLTENIPLWYLYGGIAGKGIRVGFRPVAMKDFLERINTVYPIVNGIPDRKSPLKKGIDFELKYGWVYYADYEKNIVYRGKKYIIDMGKFQEFCKDNYFIKRYSWNYENEFRIVFIFNECVGNKIAVEFDKEKYHKDKTLRLGFAPNYSDVNCGNDNEFKKIKKELKEELGLNKQIMEKSSLLINFNLLRNNLDDFIDNLDIMLNNFDKKDRLVKIKKIIEKIKR